MWFCVNVAKMLQHPGKQNFAVAVHEFIILCKYWNIAYECGLWLFYHRDELEHITSVIRGRTVDSDIISMGRKLDVPKLLLLLACEGPTFSAIYPIVYFFNSILDCFILETKF